MILRFQLVRPLKDLACKRAPPVTEFSRKQGIGHPLVVTIE